MSDTLHWEGWTLRGTPVVAPRKVRLTREEALVMRELMTLRLKHQNSYKRYALPEQLQRITSASSINAVRQVVNKLRTAIGRKAIQTEWGKGYVLLAATERNGTASSPIDDLVDNLEKLLADARRLQLSIKEGLYHE